MAITAFCTLWNLTRRVAGGSTSFSPMMPPLPLLDELADGACGPGDPVAFDPEEFVLERLQHLIENDTYS